MADSKKPLRPHAATCIKMAIFKLLSESENNGLAYNVFCDQKDCWDTDEVIPDYMCAVNIMQGGYSLGDTVKKKLKDGRTVCARRAQMDIDIQVFANGCEANCDTALAVLADIASRLFNCDDSPNNFYAHRIRERSVVPDSDEDYSIPMAMVKSRLQVDFDYVPCRPWAVFSNYKPDSQ